MFLAINILVVVRMLQRADKGGDILRLKGKWKLSPVALNRSWKRTESQTSE